MRKKGSWTIAYSILALLIFLGIMLLVFLPKISAGQKKQTEGSDIVIFGDSLMVVGLPEADVGSLLENLLGKKVLDVGFGGSGMAYADRSGNLANVRDAYNMAALTQAVISGDFRYQKNSFVKESATFYFEDQLAMLESIDFSKVSLLVIEHALNDYQAEVPLYAGENETDPYTYEGALRYVLRSFKEKYPNLIILVVSPTYVWYPEIGQTGQSRDFGYGNLEAYIKVQQEVAGSEGAFYLDLYHDLYEHEEMDDYLKYSLDGIHPADPGRALIAARMAQIIRGIL